jgi:hypothetical protein
MKGMASRIVAITGGLALAVPGIAVERVSGAAYSLAGSDLLYKETQYIAANGADRVVLYSCPDGRAFARKRVSATGDAQAPDFELVDAHLGYREGVRDRGTQREVYVQRRANMPEQAAPLSLPAGGVIDTGFDAFALRHWDELVRGESLPFPYLVPSRRTFFNFKVSRIDASDKPVAAVATPGKTMTIRRAAGNWLSFLLPHIDVVYDLASRRDVHYEGLSNIRGDDGKNYKVRADYPIVAAHKDVPQTEVDAALHEPLASSCSPADSRVSASGQPGTVPEVTVAVAARNPNP